MAARCQYIMWLWQHKNKNCVCYIKAIILSWCSIHWIDNFLNERINCYTKIDPTQWMQAAHKKLLADPEHAKPAKDRISLEREHESNAIARCHHLIKPYASPRSKMGYIGIAQWRWHFVESSSLMFQLERFRTHYKLEHWYRLVCQAPCWTVVDVKIMIITLQLHCSSEDLLLKKKPNERWWTGKWLSPQAILMYVRFMVPEVK